jgi:hypothetical protein
LHKAFLRYHDANNWPLLREALKAMGRADLIGNGKKHLIPFHQPQTDGSYTSVRRKNSTEAVGARGVKSAQPVRSGQPVRPVATYGKPVVQAPIKAGVRVAAKVSQSAKPTSVGRSSKTVRSGQILTQHTGLPPRRKS